MFNAFIFVSNIIKKAKQRIILFDNYVDENTLKLFSDKKRCVEIKIYTKNMTEKLLLGVKKFNQQHNGLVIEKFDKSHDRFLIIDDELYHFGASFKDLGKKWFAFSKISTDLNVILNNVR